MFWGITTDGHGNIIELVNFWLAQTAFFLVFILSARFIMQRVPKRSKRKTTKKTYLFFKYLHMVLGFALIVTGLLHGILSASDITSFLFSWGFICWLLSVFIALNYFFRRMFKKPRSWLILHRLLTVLIIITAMIHLVIETA